MPRPDDPRLKALAELVHQLRPTWNRGGILNVLHVVGADKSRSLESIVRAAIDAAFDKTAATPAAIQHRDGGAWNPAAQPTPIPKTRPCLMCRRIHDPDQTGCKRADPDTTQRGAAAARQALKTAKRTA